ncbi:hypothetical protein BD626DRAFT_491418 [Schizophyllum amplum]|uniref:Uncharacterized protein n=1 Tax=Schizophyllum amplum TaxID=97359 RepID=A0A550CHV9_9AGAR|nr:hypothetical protein BD626DRAFT_491418 [Auriculariopsis ampla]
MRVISSNLWTIRVFLPVGFLIIIGIGCVVACAICTAAVTSRRQKVRDGSRAAVRQAVLAHYRRHPTSNITALLSGGRAPPASNTIDYNRSLKDEMIITTAELAAVEGAKVQLQRQLQPLEPSADTITERLQRAHKDLQDMQIDDKDGQIGDLKKEMAALNEGKLEVARSLRCIRYMRTKETEREVQETDELRRQVSEYLGISR